MNTHKIIEKAEEEIKTYHSPYSKQTDKLISEAIKILKAVESAEYILTEINQDDIIQFLSDLIFDKTGVQIDESETFDESIYYLKDRIFKPTFAKLIKERDELKKAPREMSVEEIDEILKGELDGHCISSKHRWQIATALHKELYGKE